MKTEAKAISEVLVEELQTAINETRRDLKIRHERGDKNLTDSYEYGFLKACARINSVYNLGIDNINVDYGKEA